MEGPGAPIRAKSTVHRWFRKWVQQGLFETIMRDAGRLVEERDGYRLYECFIDGTFSKARGGGDGIGCTRVGKGAKIMVLVDARGLPVAVDTTPANPHESRLVQRLFDFMLTEKKPERIIGDKAYESDDLDTALAADDRSAPPEPQTAERHARRSRLAAVCATLDCRTYHPLDSELPSTLYSLGEIEPTISRLSSPRLYPSTAQTGFGIAPGVLRDVEVRLLSLAMRDLIASKGLLRALGAGVNEAERHCV